MEESLKKSTIDVNAFLPFGSLIEIGNERKKFTINNGYCERFDEIAIVEIEGNEAKPIISIFSAKPRKRPIKIDYLEMHPMGSQTFLPIHNIDWIVVVASDKDGSPDISSIKCFRVKGTQGISYKPYTWHFPLLVDREQDFWVIDRSSKSDKSQVNLKEYLFGKEDTEIYLE